MADSGMPDILARLPDWLTRQIPESLWPIYAETGDDSFPDSYHSVVEYTYQVKGPEGEPFETSLGFDHLGDDSPKPQFRKGEIITLNGVRVEVAEVEVTDQLNEGTGGLIAWFDVAVKELAEAEERRG